MFKLQETNLFFAILRWAQVPTIRFLGKDELTEELFLIESNRQRVKTDGELAREASELFRIEEAFAKQRQLAGVRVKSPEGGKAVEAVGKKLGIGEQKVRQAVAVVEEVFSKQ
jgi:hypothetical protein